jgi:hypothetical protein
MEEGIGGVVLVTGEKKGIIATPMDLLVKREEATEEIKATIITEITAEAAGVAEAGVVMAPETLKTQEVCLTHFISSCRFYSWLVLLVLILKLEK